MHKLTLTSLLAVTSVACAVADTSPPVNAKADAQTNQTTSGSSGAGGHNTSTGAGTGVGGGSSGSAGSSPAGTGGNGGTSGSGGTGGAGGAGGDSAGQGGSGGSQNGPVCNVTAQGTGTGKISYERWLGVEGSSIDLIPVSTPPSTTLEITQLEQTSTGVVHFGARFRGYLTAPLSGAYQFWIACDDNCQLSLSKTDSPASKERLAWVEGPDGWTSPQEWSKSFTQASAQVTLEKDKRYYVEVLHKQGEGGDHVEVGWQLPGESGFTPCEVVPGNVLSPYKLDGQNDAGGDGG